MVRKSAVDSIDMTPNKIRTALLSLLYAWCLGSALCVLSIPHAFATPEASGAFKLGGLFSLTGFGQRAGEAELRGTQLAVEEINQQGGVGGHPIQLTVEDFRSDLKTTAAAMQKLSAFDKVAAIVGPNWSEFSEVAAGVANRNQVVMITPSGYTKTLTKDRPFVFSALESHSAFTAPLSKYIATQRPKRLAALVMQNTFHHSVFDALSSQLSAAGVPVWQSFEVTPGNQG